MSFRDWLTSKRHSSGSTASRPTRVRVGGSAGLHVMRLEKRRLLNGDFSLLGGVDLLIDNVDADLTIQESATDFQFILNSGQWTGTDVIGSVVGNGTNSLDVNKATLNALTGGVSVNARAATRLDFDSVLASLDLSNMVGELEVNDFATVNQVVGSAQFSDISVNDSSLISLGQFAANDISFVADEIDFGGGVDSVTGSSLQIQTSSVSTIVLGGAGSNVAELNFSDTDISALANGFSEIEFGSSAANGNSTIVVDPLGASFGDNLSLNAGGLAGAIRIDGQLDTVADADVASISINGNGNGAIFSADVLTAGGTLFVNDGFLVEGAVTVDTTAANTVAGGDVTIIGAVDGFGTAANVLTLDTAFGIADGVNDGDVLFIADIEGMAGPQSLANGEILDGLFVEAGSLRLPNVASGIVQVVAADIDLTGQDYLSQSSLLLDGDVSLVSSGLIQLTSGGSAGDDITVTGTIVDPGLDSTLSINAGAAGRVDFQDKVGTLLAITVDRAAHVDIAEVETVGTIEIAADTIDLNGSRYESQTAGVTITGDVFLAGPPSTLITVQSGGDQGIAIIDSVTGTQNDLAIRSEGDVELGPVDLGANDVQVFIDLDNDGIHSAMLDSISAGQVSILGSLQCNDLVELNGVISSVSFDLRNVAMLQLNEAVETTTGDVTIEVCNDFQFGAGGRISTNGGDVNLVADANSNGNGRFEMDQSSFIDAGNGTVTISAAEDVVLSSISTTNATSAAIDITSQSGNVVGVGGGPHIIADSASAVTTINAGSNIGVAGADVMFDAGFVPVVTFANALDLTAAGDIVVEDVSPDVLLLNIEAGVGVAETVWVKALGDIDLRSTTGLESIDDVALISDGSVLLPSNFSAADLRLDGNSIIAPGTVTADNLLLQADQSVAMTIDVSRFDGTSNGNLDIVSVHGPAEVELYDLNNDGTALQSFATTADGDVRFQADSSIRISDLVSVRNDGQLLLQSNGGTSDVLVNANILSANGSLDVLADRNISIAANQTVESIGGSIGLIADQQAGSFGGEIVMNDLATVRSTTGEIELAADGDITVGAIETSNATMSAIRLVSESGAVVDGGDSAIDITANSTGAAATIRTATGIGSSDTVEIQVDFLDAVNSSTGAILIREVDSIRLKQVEQTESDRIEVLAANNIDVFAGGDGVSVQNASNLNQPSTILMQTQNGSITVNQSVTNRSDHVDSTVVLDANGVPGNIEVNSDVSTVLGGIQLFADNRLDFGADGLLRAGSTGDITVVANANDANGSPGDGIVMADGAFIDSQSGTITLTSVGQNSGDIGLGGLLSTNATSAAILITTDGRVFDNGDSDIDIVANQLSGRVSILANQGIGSISGSAIETSVDEIVAINDDGLLPATGNIAINETDDLRIILLDNNTSTTETDLIPTGAIEVSAGGNIFVIDDGDDQNAAIQSEESVQLTGENISVNDDIVAIDDTAGIGGDNDESIGIFARGDFELLDNRTISTDDDPLIRTVVPGTATGDQIVIEADTDRNATDADGDGVADSGIVFFAETSSIRTDGGVANLFADRPDPDQTDPVLINGVPEPNPAFFDPTTILVSELNFIEISTAEGNVYEGLLTVFIGNEGEENLIFTVDWGDSQFANVTQQPFADFPLGPLNLVDPDSAGRFNGEVDGDKNNFLIPVGGREYVIPHRYTDFDISLDVENQPLRTEASDPFPVRFAVSHHVPSIEVNGRAIVDPIDMVAGPLPVPTSDDVAPLARLSTTNIVDLPADDLPRFDSGVTAFTVVTRSVPRSLLVKEEVEVPDVKPIDAPSDAVFVDDATLSEQIETSTRTESVSSEDFFQLRRSYADGTTDIIIQRISEGEGDQLFDQASLEAFVAEENLNDGSGYEIWLITEDPNGNVPVERPVFEFEVTAGKPGPASEDLPDKFEKLKLVPLDELEEPETQAPGGEPETDGEAGNDVPNAVKDNDTVAVPMDSINGNPAVEHDASGNGHSTASIAAATVLFSARKPRSKFSRYSRVARRLRNGRTPNRNSEKSGNDG